MPLAHPFARSLAPLTHSHCSLRSRAPLRSFVRSLAYSGARGKETFVYGMNASISFSFSPLCAGAPRFGTHKSDVPSLTFLFSVYSACLRRSDDMAIECPIEEIVVTKKRLHKMVHSFHWDCSFILLSLLIIFWLRLNDSKAIAVIWIRNQKLRKDNEISEVAHYASRLCVWAREREMWHFCTN